MLADYPEILKKNNVSFEKDGGSIVVRYPRNMFFLIAVGIFGIGIFLFSFWLNSRKELSLVSWVSYSAAIACFYWIYQNKNGQIAFTLDISNRRLIFPVKVKDEPAAEIDFRDISGISIDGSSDHSDSYVWLEQTDKPSLLLLKLTESNETELKNLQEFFQSLFMSTLEK